MNFERIGLPKCYARPASDFIEITEKYLHGLTAHDIFQQWKLSPSKIMMMYFYTVPTKSLETFCAEFPFKTIENDNEISRNIS